MRKNSNDATSFSKYEQEFEELMALNEERLNYTTDYKSAYKNADAIFISVGTPEQPDGSTTLSYIATVARQIAETEGY